MRLINTRVDPSGRGSGPLSKTSWVRSQSHVNRVDSVGRGPANPPGENQNKKILESEHTQYLVKWSFHLLYMYI